MAVPSRASRILGDEREIATLARYHLGPLPSVGGHRERSASMKVGDWMSRRVVTCRTQDDLSQVARQMWDKDLGCLPVVDGEDRIVGIVTDRDLCMGAYIKGRALHDLVVSACMQRELHTCRPEDGIDLALGLMAERQIRRLPVVTADGKIAGTISLADAARAAASVKEARGRRLLAEAVSPRARRDHRAAFPGARERESGRARAGAAKKAPRAQEKSSKSSSKRR
jgi:CBS domain-containing protein